MLAGMAVLAGLVGGNSIVVTAGTGAVVCSLGAAAAGVVAAGAVAAGVVDSEGAGVTTVGNCWLGKTMLGSAGNGVVNGGLEFSTGADARLDLYHV